MPFGPAVSIIMPNFNGEARIKRSIESVLEQNFSDFELLVVDDGSEDHSIDIIEGFGDIRIRLLQQEHRGVCAARNLAIAQSRGDSIAFLDSDDTWAVDFLRKLRDALLRVSDAALAYCGWQNVGLEGGRNKPFIPPDYENPEKLELWLRNCRWPIHAALTRREAIEAVGGFDARYPTSEDFLLWLRIVTQNKIIRVPEVLAFYQHHEGHQASKDRARLALNHLEVQQEYLRGSRESRKALGWSKIRELTFGELLRRGYDCYWQRDLVGARRIFRRLMRAGYGRPHDWKYMVPALLPLGLHRRLVAGGSVAAGNGIEGRSAAGRRWDG